MITTEEDAEEIGMSYEKRIKASLNFPKFIQKFLRDCYYGKNFNKLLRDNASKMKQYLFEYYDVHRYYNPDTAIYIYGRESGFGFDNRTDFSTNISNEKLKVHHAIPQKGFCEKSLDADGIYYFRVDSLPNYYDPKRHEWFSESIGFQTDPPMMKAIILRNHWIEKVFYFMAYDEHIWLLLSVDDTVCRD